MTARNPHNPTDQEVRDLFSRITEALGATTAPGGSRSRTQVSTLTGFKTQPTAEDLDTVERIYLEEGFRDVQAVPAQGQAGRGWEIAVFAGHNPYARP